MVLGAVEESPQLRINADKYLRYLHLTIPEGQGLFWSVPLEYTPVTIEGRSGVVEVSLRPLLLVLCSAW